MAYVYFNSNPRGLRVGDCAVRAMCKAVGQEWEDAYAGLCSIGFSYADGDDNEEKIEILRDVMGEASSEDERRMIQKIIRRMEKD